MLDTKPERERTCIPTAALSRTVRFPSGRVVWGTVARPRRARRCMGHCVTFDPLTRTTPRSTGCSPEMQPSSVDFPAPFGPIKHVSDPGKIARKTSSTA